jgi:hypothetical protein
MHAPAEKSGHRYVRERRPGENVARGGFDSGKEEAGAPGFWRTQPLIATAAYVGRDPIPSATPQGIIMPPEQCRPGASSSCEAVADVNGYAQVGVRLQNGYLFWHNLSS